jgi:hypothetical protein
MASAPPLPGEFHKLVIVLSGSMLDARTKRKLADYKKYMKAMRAVARKHGARVVSKEIHLKQGTIDKRKKALRKKARQEG